jgi:SPP1 gp7 family putative phage head morphogenesis protein
MDSQISRVLAQAMADGKNPREIARLLTRTISGPMGDLGITDTLGRFIPAERRAKMLARTEIIRAHAEAELMEFKNWAVAEVKVKAELVTAGDDRVCIICQSLEGQTFTLDQASGIIPVHPACRCNWIPLEITRG